MPIAFVIREKITLLIFFIAQGSVQLSLHQLLKNVLEAFLEEGIDISHTV